MRFNYHPTPSRDALMLTDGLIRSRRSIEIGEILERPYENEEDKDVTSKRMLAGSDRRRVRTKIRTLINKLRKRWALPDEEMTYWGRKQYEYYTGKKAPKGFVGGIVSEAAPFEWAIGISMSDECTEFQKLDVLAEPYNGFILCFWEI